MLAFSPFNKTEFKIKYTTNPKHAMGTLSLKNAKFIFLKFNEIKIIINNVDNKLTKKGPAIKLIGTKISKIKNKKFDDINLLLNTLSIKYGIDFDKYSIMQNLQIKITLIIIAILLQYLILKYRTLIGNYLHLIDIPNKQKIHENPTPLIGSFSTVIFFLIANSIILYENFNVNLLLILLISLSFFFIGIIDDRYNLNAYKKFLITILILLIFFSFSEKLVITQLYSSSFHKYFELGRLDVFFTILCVLLLSNALNLADGINGLAAGISSIWMVIITFYSKNEYNNIYFIISSLMIINTYFIYKGKYFLGDSGSLFFGSTVSLLLIYNYNEAIPQKIIPLETIFIFFMVPGIDMFRLFLFRIAKKKNPFSRDLDHLHHHLIKIFSLPKVLVIYFGIILLPVFLDYFFISISLYIICAYITIYIIFILYLKFKKTF